MADETVISTDTTTSPANEPPVAAPAVEAVAQSEGAEGEAPVAAADDGEGTVLGGKVGDEAPAAEDVEAAAGVPEKYELALEGFTIDEELLSAADPVFRELNLSNDQANALLPMVPKIIEKAQNSAMQSIIDAGAAQRKAWLDAYAADPEIGGAQREATEQLAAKGLDGLGFTEGHPFRTALTETGFGNHPDMIRAFRRIGEMLSEDGAFFRSNDGTKVESPIWERMYPNG